VERGESDDPLSRAWEAVRRPGDSGEGGGGRNTEERGGDKIKTHKPKGKMYFREAANGTWAKLAGEGGEPSWLGRILGVD
jgi:hypothetical protein